FGTLFYLREFLPLACFGDRDLTSVSHQHTQLITYDDFIQGKSSKSAGDPKTEGDSITAHPRKKAQPLKIILRNRHDKADRILDLFVS
ncbi:DNA binding protein, partial [Ascosphaera atra]